MSRSASLIALFALFVGLALTGCDDTTTADANSASEDYPLTGTSADEEADARTASNTVQSWAAALQPVVSATEVGFTAVSDSIPGPLSELYPGAASVEVAVNTRTGITAVNVLDAAGTPLETLTFEDRSTEDTEQLHIVSLLSCEREACATELTYTEDAAGISLQGRINGADTDASATSGDYNADGTVDFPDFLGLVSADEADEAARIAGVAATAGIILDKAQDDEPGATAGSVGCGFAKGFSKFAVFLGKTGCCIETGLIGCPICAGVGHAAGVLIDEAFDC